MASSLGRALAERGLDAEPASVDQLLGQAAQHGDRPDPNLGFDAIALAPDSAPSLDQVAALDPLCRAAASTGCPVVVLAVFPHARGRAAHERAAALAFLRSSGAILCSDPDIWLEALCLIAGHGLPGGPRAAIVAPPGSWLASAATALAGEAELLGNRFPLIATSTSQLEPADIALVDPAALSPSTPDRVGQTRVVPIVARAEFLDQRGRLALVGLRSALGAVAACGALARRLDAGLGPDQPPGRRPEVLDELAPDLERFTRQLDKLDPLDVRAGDHEAKVLIASWGIEVTRQAVATTPSAAIRIAKKAGYPVEIKPWGPDQLSERDGCPVHRDLTTASDVRRAFDAVARAAGLPDGSPVIVRATPPRGREVCAHIADLGPVGWMVI
ncbi:MAG: acetate--CoA ligase family protein, partial [Myxococcota bacterium]